MSVEFWVIFVVFQIAFAESHGITLPFTSLIFKSLPTAPKESISSNCEKAETTNEIADVNVIETSPKAVHQSFLQNSLSNTISSAYKNEPYKTTFKSLEIPDARTESTKEKENVKKFHNSKTNMSTLLEVPTITFPSIERIDNNEKNIYSPNKLSLMATSVNDANNKNTKGICLEPPSPKLNYVNEQTKQSIYQDLLQINSKPGNYQSPTKLTKKNLASNREIIPTQLKIINDDCILSDVPENLLEAINTQKRSDKINISCKENIKSTKSIEKLTNAASKVSVTPVLQQKLAENKEEINVRSNVPNIYNNWEVTYPSPIKYEKSNIHMQNIVPCNPKMGENIVASVEPVVTPVNNAATKIPQLDTYLNDIPTLYKLPNVYAKNEIVNLVDNIPLISQNKFKPEFITASPTNMPILNPYNVVSDSVITDVNKNISPVSKNGVSTHLSDISACSTPSLVISNPEVTIQQPSYSYVNSIPSSIVPVDPVANCDNLLLEKITNSGIMTSCPRDSPSSVADVDSGIIEINQNNVRPPNYVPEFLPNVNKLTTLPNSPYSSSTYPTTDLLNNIISFLITGLLSAFYSPSRKITDNILPISSIPVPSDVTSSFYSESSISSDMPTFLLNPPPLPTPTFLPIPKVTFSNAINTTLLKKKPIVQQRRPYISSITINLLPAEETVDEIIVIL